MAVGAPQLSGSNVRQIVGQQVGQPSGNGTASQSSLPTDAQLAGRVLIFELKQVAGQLSMISRQGVGAGDGAAVGSFDGSADGLGDGIIVGEQTGGLPSGDSVNIGWSGRHSKAQHVGQLISDGVGITLQSGRLTLGSVHSGGRDGSS